LPTGQKAHAVPTMMEPDGHCALQSAEPVVEVRPVRQSWHVAFPPREKRPEVHVLQ
jgi:hypothetical protein